MKIITALSVLLTIFAARAEPIRTPRATLKAFVESLSVSESSKKQVYALIGDPDGFGVRLEDILHLEPARVPQDLRDYVAKLHLGFGLSRAEIQEYAEFGYVDRLQFDTAGPVDELSPHTRAFLERNHNPTAKQLAEVFSEAVLNKLHASPTTKAEIRRLVESAGYRFKTRTRSKVYISKHLNHRSFDQFEAELDGGDSQNYDDVSIYRYNCFEAIRGY